MPSVVGDLLLDIAYDHLDNESVDVVRAWWRLRRLRKYKASKAWARFQGGSLPAPKNPPRPAIGAELDNSEFFRKLQEAREWSRESQLRRQALEYFGSLESPKPHFTTSDAAMLSSGRNESPTNSKESAVGLFANVKLSDVKVGSGKAMDFKGEGSFVKKVVEVKGGQTRKKENYFEVIFEVVQSTNQEQAIGSKVNLFCMLAGSGQDLGLQNMKEILCTLSGLNPHSNSDAAKIEQITDEQWTEIAELACADQKTFGGRLVNCDVVQTEVKNKKAGGRTHYLRRRYTPNEATVKLMAEANAPKAESKKAK